LLYMYVAVAVAVVYS